MIRLNRELLQQLSEQHLGDVQVLLERKRWPGAYYLAGYSVECALKACIAKLTRANDFPHKDSPKVFTHNLDLLVELAGLKQARINRAESSRDFKLSWAEVLKWSEESRYDLSTGEREAKNLINAISDNQEGVLPWIKRHW
jgi:HEPN domain-containing protein